MTSNLGLCNYAKTEASDYNIYYYIKNSDEIPVFDSNLEYLSHETYEEIKSNPKFNDIIYLSIDCKEEIINDILANLPPNLIELHVSQCDLTKVPDNLPESVKILDLTSNNISEVSINNDSIEILDLSDNTSDTDEMIIKRLPLSLKKLDISYTETKELLIDMPENLEYLNIGNTEIRTIPNCPNLKVFDASQSYIESIDMLCDNLKELTLIDIEIKTITKLPASIEKLDINSCTELLSIKNIPEGLTELTITACPNLSNIDNIPNTIQKLTVVHCENITEIPDLEDTVCVNLNLEGNDLEFVPDLPRTLRSINVSNNKRVKSFPLTIITCVRLRQFEHRNCEMDHQPRIRDFLANITTNVRNGLFYDDSQGVHDSTIQKSVSDSIVKLLKRKDIPQFDQDKLINLVVNNTYLNDKTKSALVEYSKDTTIHSILGITFAEALWLVVNTIENDFAGDTDKDKEKRKDIYAIMNIEIEDAICKCFTGRISRLINCLTGISEDVNIQIADTDQIGNVIIIVRNRLIKENDYSVEKHKEIVKEELLERGFDEETINNWIEYIDEFDE